MLGEEITVKDPIHILSEGQEICENCNGHGFIKVFVNRYDKRKLPCGNCGGKGTIWWTEKATGIDNVPYFDYDDSSSSISITSSSQSSVRGNCGSSGFTPIQITTVNITKNEEEKICPVSQRLLKMIKSIWHVIITQSLNPFLKDIVRIVKSFKMGLT